MRNGSGPDWLFIFLLLVFFGIIQLQMNSAKKSFDENAKEIKGFMDYLVEQGVTIKVQDKEIKKNNRILIKHTHPFEHRHDHKHGLFRRGVINEKGAII